MSWLRPSEQKRGNRMNQDNLDCISVANMRESDRLTIERFCPGRRLMYRAALGVFRATDWDGVTAIAVGGGNNGENLVLWLFHLIKIYIKMTILRLEKES